MATGTQANSGLLSNLYHGRTRIDFIGHRRRWYLASAIIVVVCLGAIAIRGFNWGIEFSGGDKFQVPVKPDTTLSQVRAAVEGTGVTVSSAQTAGSGGAASYVIKTEKLTSDQRHAVHSALANSAHTTEITNNEVSSSWGSDVTRRAIYALIIFLGLVALLMALRFRDVKASGAALLALFHDLVLTAGVYALVGFEVTPGTVVGLLTILGYSLYDTVVVFDKVDENTKGILGTSRYTYAEAANLAVNQTLMRSINTSLIGLLPVAGLLFVGAGLLGVGTLEDLALVLFVGMLTGAYSSLFLATPWLVTFKLADQRYRNHERRVLNKRTAGATRAAASQPDAGRADAVKASGGKASGADASASGARPADLDDLADGPDQDDVPGQRSALAGAAPRVGAKPSPTRQGNRRPGGTRASGRSGSAKRHR